MKDPSSGPQYPLPPRTIEAAYYLDPAQYEREFERIFMRSWMPACSSGELAAPRDYFVWDRLRQSVVIVRQQDGTLAAWHNVCRHRGARLVEISGNAKFGKFKCPWHGFSYDLAGKCVSVPLRESFDERELMGLRTVTVRVAEWNGLVWITLSADTPELRDYLGDLWDELGYYQMENFEIRYRHTVELHANWKAVIDAFNETWHVPFTHQETLSGLMLWRDARLKICSPHSWMTLPIAKYTERAGPDADHHQANVCHYTAFPNTIFSCFPTHLQMWSAWPLSPTRTLLTAWGVVGPTPAGLTEEKWSEQSDRNWAHFLSVMQEDAQVLNGIGTVSHSLGYQGSLFNTAEGRLTAFHDEVMSRVGPR